VHAVRKKQSTKKLHGLSKEACRRCPLKDTCCIKTPTSPNGSRIDTRFSNCTHFTCMQGRYAAIAALQSGQPFETFQSIDGQTHLGVPFGTEHKATDIPTSRFQRFVTTEGEIYTQELEKPAQLTAVRVR